MTHVKISEKNSKLGRIANISLTPIESCPKDIECAKICYAIRPYRRYPATRAAWDRNWHMFLDSPRNYRDSIIHMLKHGKLGTSGLFRFHVGGDIPNQEYLEGMKEIAETFPETRFMAFTKAVFLDFSDLPGNLSILESAWAGKPTVTDLPIAYVKELDNRAENHEIVHDCQGNCISCRKCWNANKGEAINLHLH